MSYHPEDGEERTFLDYFASAMDFLSRDKILIPFSYAVIALGVGLGTYQLALKDNSFKSEIRNAQSLEAIAYDLPRQR